MNDNIIIKKVSKQKESIDSKRILENKITFIQKSMDSAPILEDRKKSTKSVQQNDKPDNKPK